MKLIQNNDIFVPIYHAKNEIFNEDYNSLLKIYQKSFKLQSKDFQSLYDCLSIQLMYWLNDFEEDRDKSIKEKLVFEIEGLDFYKFFYNDFEWYPYLILERYDGFYLYDDEITDVKYSYSNESILFDLTNNIQLELSKSEFPIIFKCEMSEINKTIIELINSKKLYFDGGQYFFINEKNYKKLMLYMIEQVTFLNKAYRYLNLKEILIE